MLEALFLIVWISLEALIIWLILHFMKDEQPQIPPPCYGHSHIVRSQRVGDKDSPNFYRKS